MKLKLIQKKSCSCSWFTSNLHPTWQQHTEPRSLSTSPPLSRTPYTVQVLTYWWWVSVVTELSLGHSKCGSRTCRGPRGVSKRCRKKGLRLKSASYYLTGIILSKVWKFTKFEIFDGCTIIQGFIFLYSHNFLTICSLMNDLGLKDQWRWLKGASVEVFCSSWWAEHTLLVTHRSEIRLSLF